MHVSDAIRTKRAIRKFQEKPLPEDVIHAILNAGRRSQSSKNEQAWHFIAIRDRSILEALSECGTYAGHLAGAVLAVAILTPDPTTKFQMMFDAGHAARVLGAGSRLGASLDLRGREGARDPGIPARMAFADRTVIWVSSGRGEILCCAEEGWTQVTGRDCALGQMVTRFQIYDLGFATG
jgi:nitroreductase